MKKTQRGRLSRKVLSGSQRDIQYDAAWDFLDAVKELFPKKFEELNRLHESLETPHDEEAEMDPDEIYDLQEPAAEWARRHNILSDAVADVAWRIAAGLYDMPLLSRHFDKQGRMIKFPSITALPDEETAEEFVVRAKKHYNQMRELFIERGYKSRPIKHEREHFKYLAAHRIGGFSWAQIASGKTALPLAVRAASTVAEEAREAAVLIGLPMPTKPGPRPGSRIPRNPRRRRTRRP